MTSLKTLFAAKSPGPYFEIYIYSLYMAMHASNMWHIRYAELQHAHSVHSCIMNLKSINVRLAPATKLDLVKGAGQQLGHRLHKGPNPKIKRYSQQLHGAKTSRYNSSQMFTSLPPDPLPTHQSTLRDATPWWWARSRWREQRRRWLLLALICRHVRTNSQWPHPCCSPGLGSYTN